MITRKEARTGELDLYPIDADPAAATVIARSANRISDSLRRNDEERIHIFWRVFGGAILSITALTAITLYNSVQAGITELRSEVAKLNDVRGDLVRKDEFNSRISANYERLGTIQTQNTTQAAAVLSLKTDLDAQKERIAKQASDLDAVRKESTAAAEEYKKDIAALEVLKEKLTLLAAESKVVREDVAKARAELEKTQVTENERKLRRDEQMKEYDKALKELQAALQACQVKLARLEGAQQATPPKPKETP